MINLIIAFFIQSSFSFAGVEFIPSKQILMTGKSCEELAAHAESIANWTESLSNVSTEVPECFCSSKSCRMDVAQVSPYFVKDLTNYGGSYDMATAFAGPNCFNAALVLSSTLTAISFTHPYEMTAILNSSLCRERKITEQLVPGDILVVRDQKQEYFEIHAGIYISETLSFSKYGEANMMPYSYGMDVHKSYGVHDETCGRIEGIPVAGEHCFEKPFVNYFKCDGMYTFVSKLVNGMNGLNPVAQKIYASTSSFDLAVSGIAHKGDAVTADELQKLQADIFALYGRTESALADTTVDKDNLELVRLMRFRLYSLFEQTRRIAKGSGYKHLIADSLETPKQ